jgi:hypothetical protein
LKEEIEKEQKMKRWFIILSIILLSILECFSDVTEDDVLANLNCNNEEEDKSYNLVPYSNV